MYRAHIVHCLFDGSAIAKEFLMKQSVYRLHLFLYTKKAVLLKDLKV